MNYKLELLEKIEHHGIKGQKWGIRRDPDTLASAAREKAFKKTYEKRGEMSTKELEDTVKRMRLENEMSRLASDASRMTDTRTTGQKIMDDMKKKAITVATDQASKSMEKVVRKRIDSAIEKATGGLVKNVATNQGERRDERRARQNQNGDNNQSQTTNTQSTPPPPPPNSGSGRTTSSSSNQSRTTVVTSPPPGARSIDQILADSRNTQTDGGRLQDINNRILDQEY